MNQTTETRPRHAGIYDELLQPGPLALETGVHRLDDGRLLVAVRTELPAAPAACSTGGLTSSTPPSISAGGIRTIMCNCTAGASRAGRAAAMSAPRCAR